MKYVVRAENYLIIEAASEEDAARLAPQAFIDYYQSAGIADFLIEEEDA